MTRILLNASNYSKESFPVTAQNYSLTQQFSCKHFNVECFLKTKLSQRNSDFPRYSD